MLLSDQSALRIHSVMCVFSTYVYQEQCSAGSFRLAPVSPEHGMKWMSFLGLNPTFLRNGTSFSLHSSYLWRKVHEHWSHNLSWRRCTLLIPLPIQAPVHSGVVHFVHKDDQVFDSGCFGQHGVLSRLASFFKPCLKLAFTCWNHLRDNQRLHCVTCPGPSRIHDIIFSTLKVIIFMYTWLSHHYSRFIPDVAVIFSSILQGKISMTFLERASDKDL